MRRTARDPGNRLGSAGTPTWLVGGPGAWSRVCDASTLHAWLPDRSLPAERGLCLRHGSRPLILLRLRKQHGSLGRPAHWENGRKVA